MKITCNSCGAKYTIADDKVRGRRVKVRCKSCSTPIIVDGKEPEAESAAGALSNATAPATAEEQETAAAPPEVASDAWSVNLSDTDQRTMTTKEILDGWGNGTITDDAFVWKDGMADWVPVMQVSELREAIEASRASAAATAVKAREPSFPVARPAAVARVTGGRTRGAADLFGAVETAGAEGDASLGEAMFAPSIDQKPSGARNENSVLFSLDALKAGFSPPTPAKPRPKQPAFTPTPDDPFGMSKGNSGLSGIGGSNAIFALDNQALLTAPAPPPPEPDPPPTAVNDVAHGQFAAAAFTRKKPPDKRILAIGAALALCAVIGIIVAVSGSDDKPEEATRSAENEESKRASESRGDKAEKKTEQANQDDKKDDKSGPAVPDKKPDEKPPVTEEEKKKYAAAKKHQDVQKASPDSKKDEEKPEAKPTDGPPFSKGAAIAALSSAASAASGCKRPGGPTGKGKALITFAPSGRVTSANITGGSFGGTSVGGCISAVFRRAKVPPFGGNAVTVSKSFNVAP